ncbi:BURP domain protein RD22-like [Cryptomeria japonica]|uniref:BURP domain protein RD22-like n=1 Tax=Cryptomeria japonica TaxID=3369 RepID=UPI0027DA9894|nr:BURP domain protein RD22-like [Cryptomeria japonica]
MAAPTIAVEATLSTYLNGRYPPSLGISEIIQFACLFEHFAPYEFWLFSVAASGARYLQGGEKERLSLTPSIAYWHEKLPMTPIPQSLWELISPDEVNVAKEGVNSIRLVQELESTPKTENPPDRSYAADRLPFFYRSYAADKSDELPFFYRSYAADKSDEIPFFYRSYAADKTDEFPFFYRSYAVDKSDELPFFYRSYAPEKSNEMKSDEIPFFYPSYTADKSNELPFFYRSYAADVQMPTTHSSQSVFLLEKDLVSGTKKYLSYSNTQKMHFLPRSVADKIPFSSDNLSVALKELNIAPDSDMGLAMKQTLKVCEAPPVKGETKYCATSLESMIDYITSKLGSNGVTVLATNVPKGKTSKSVKHQYSITGVQYKSQGEKPVYVCHTIKYAYAVYFCHELQGTKIARVSVKGEDGSMVEAATICHTDTSAWNPKHVAFLVLNVKPGAASVCHFIPENHFVWLGAN